jgi:hypothetical protein
MSQHGPRFSLFVFDKAQIVKEGEEEKKALCSFPEGMSANQIKGAVGLAEGLITFTAVFSPRNPCEVMHAEHHRQVFYQCEQDLWSVLVRLWHYLQPLISRCP